MHELAHCMQMNHSAAFWKVRNQYDGFWGHGKTVLSEQYDNTGSMVPEVMPRTLCGGTFRSRGRKRKRKGGQREANNITYAERQQKRIAKKFGTNGAALGGDEEIRVKLEHGLKVKAKPKVAGSARGRELRAAAALARFGQQKEEEITKSDVGAESGSETEDDYDNSDVGVDALDQNGARILDGKGNGMVKVCENEDQNDIHVKQELQELQELEDFQLRTTPNDAPCNQSGAPKASTSKVEAPRISKTVTTEKQITTEKPKTSDSSSRGVSNEPRLALEEVSKPLTCPICSMDNGPLAITCLACSHVLVTSKVHAYWNCKNDACSKTGYLNADDSTLCGICGARRQAT